MAYEPTTWQNGDIITAEKLNKIEEGIAESGGYEVEIVPTTLAEGQLKYEHAEELNVYVSHLDFSMPEQGSGTVDVTFNGVTYNGLSVQIYTKDGESVSFIGAPFSIEGGALVVDWSEYPFVITTIGAVAILCEQAPADTSLTVVHNARQSVVSGDFKRAVNNVGSVGFYNDNTYAITKQVLIDGIVEWINSLNGAILYDNIEKISRTGGHSSECGSYGGYIEVMQRGKPTIAVPINCTFIADDSFNMSVTGVCGSYYFEGNCGVEPDTDSDTGAVYVVCGEIILPTTVQSGISNPVTQVILTDFPPTIEESAEESTV